MRTVQIEHLRPEEILLEKNRFSTVYLPLGPLEWHGPAMLFGTDPLVAQEVARAAARVTGGVVMPTLFVGTERERPSYILEAKGFEDPNQYIVGMDVPKNAVKSYYAREDIFAVMVREHLRLLVQQGYRLIVIVNGHGAWGQKETLKRLAVEFSHETPSTVVVTEPEVLRAGETDDYGHATLLETSLVRQLFDEDVDLSRFPPRDVPLKYTDYGIADDFVFSGERTPDDCVRFDPRDATPALGKRYIDNAVSNLITLVNDTYAKL